MKTQNFLSLAAIALTAMLISTPAKGQIVWGSAATIASDSDVATNGTYFDAALLQDGANSGAPLTVNGVVFNIIPHGNVASDPSGDISLNSSRNPFSGGDSPSGTSAYNTLVSEPEYGQNNSQTLTLNNLTIGDTYQVEVWSAAIGSSAFVTDLSGTNSPSLNAKTGQFVIGTFTATASTFSFTASNDATSVNGVNMLNAISVFNEGEQETVPEPSTYALLLGSVAALVFIRSRQPARR